MDVFALRQRLVDDYATYASSFIEIQDPRIQHFVKDTFQQGVFWPESLIQLNPSFRRGDSIDQLVADQTLHPECASIFRKGKDQGENKALFLHQHQLDAIQIAQQGHNYVLTTGTGSGKSLAYIVPIVDHVLRRGSGKGIQAIIVYPMNALANSQYGELEKFLVAGYPEGKSPVTFAKYTGQERDVQRREIIANPPDILLTNYVMLELLLTRPREQGLMAKATDLRFLVLDELHTYRGRQGADVALLIRRVRDRLGSEQLQTVGTSATLAGEGTYGEQQQEVAQIATQVFGAAVYPQHIVGETLERATPEIDESDSGFVQRLVDQVSRGAHAIAPTDYQAFVQHPFSSWIESTFGLTTDSESGHLKRSQPRGISGEEGAARRLAELTQVAEESCAQAIQRWLLAGYECEPNPETGFPPFAFRLHQFVSPGDTVYASLEEEENRHITVRGQQFVPGSDRQQILLPLVFCRECGQEYYSIRLIQNDDKQIAVKSRDFADRFDDEEGEAGYLYLSTRHPWPSETEDVLERLPEDWLEEHKGSPRIRSHRKKLLPRELRLTPAGMSSKEGHPCTYVTAPFMFCLHCGVSYAARQTDFGKLATLSSEGRSSATTILSLSAIRHLREELTLPEHARKLLSFTDNRQDASLQAGHFNDFVEIGLLRGALYRAVHEAGPAGISHELLAQKVFDALNLPLEIYANDPQVRYQALEKTKQALRQIIGYRLYRDLRRGWRITSPNLEQCGLLQIEYESLAEVCQDEQVWAEAQPVLATALPQTRAAVAKVLLDYMRRELAIRVSYLDSQEHERMKQLSDQLLKGSWALDEDERLEYAAILFPQSSSGDNKQGNVYMSARGGLGMYLRRSTTFTHYKNKKITLDETDQIIRQLLEVLRIAGIVEVVLPPRSDDDVPGYQLYAQSMRWLAGDGRRAFHDPIRVPQESEGGSRPNTFFVDFYRTVAETLVGLEAREHTAQVPYQERIEREDLFRSGALPILYCSPTMELGVDIAELNVVNLRNVPPTPANYAQRSGRAGRSGQPALVFTYCSVGSPHDQYFFKRPAQMVSGAVTPPRLDLANEDLVRAHVHAIWLAESGINLGDTLKEILDLSGEQPSLDLLDHVRDQMEAQSPRARTRQRAYRVLSMIGDELQQAGWYNEQWLDSIMAAIGHRFDATCDRWRGLYRAALRQMEMQNNIIRDASRGQSDKNQAKRLWREAVAQLELLGQSQDVFQSDFYSYRYFATEGFLPGYSFPRLPISAFIPARKTRQRDEFLSRPRFLAISEFGPRAIVYHEGSKYIINQVILPVGEEEGPLTRQAKQCENCGYLHPITDSQQWDLCEYCGSPLPPSLTSLLRLQNVITQRRDRINSDEEERLKLGYEIRTGVRFPEREGVRTDQRAEVRCGDEVLAHLTYAQAATLWRINMGWARRKVKGQHGFILDIERGYWARSDQVDDEDKEEPLSSRTQRVIPYVEDSRNCLLFEPAYPMDVGEFASVQAALKRAIEAYFQLESNELAVESLPDLNQRRSILFYEAAEGGAGVLRRLMDEPETLAGIARLALDICHFDPDTLEDLHQGPRAKEPCEAACYDCLLGYSNQREHELLDRQLAFHYLEPLMQSRVISSPTSATREDHLTRLGNLAGSDLERDWLDYLDSRGYRLPDDAQVLFEACGTRPDFYYGDQYAVIYIDGSPHDYPHLQQRDQGKTACMEDMGYTVIRFGYRDDWDAILARYPYVFGGEA